MSNVKIRLAKVTDLDEIQELLEEVWLDTYPNEKLGITKEIIAKRFESNKSNPEEMQKRRESFKEGPGYWIAEEDGKVIGFVRAYKLENDNGQIKAICLSPKSIGKGFGRMLMETALDHLKDCKEVIVECAAYNERALNFYKKFEFDNSVEIEAYKLNEECLLPQVRLTRKNHD